MSKGKKPKLGLIVTAIIAGYFIYTIAGQESLLNKKQNEKKRIEASIEEQKQLNEDLKKQKEEVNSDQYIERVAREKLGMVKPGEKVFSDVNK